MISSIGRVNLRNEKGWHPPAWIYRDRKPSSDDQYFENMTRVIFQAGLAWNMIDTKWPNFQKAFANFSIDRVAQFDNNVVEDLLKDKGIVRNKAKMQATIENAKQFRKIRAEHGSFKAYLESVDKSQNYASAMKEISQKFHRLGPSSAWMFLYSVGENIKYEENEKTNASLTNQ